MSVRLRRLAAKSLCLVALVVADMGGDAGPSPPVLTDPVSFTSSVIQEALQGIGIYAKRIGLLLDQVPAILLLEVDGGEFDLLSVGHELSQAGPIPSQFLKLSQTSNQKRPRFTAKCMRVCSASRSSSH